ncbi:MAG: beta-ketoacyl-[acyl-carrier-protein] synthase II [Nitrospiraceae bacterium]|nr:MAG: beta-ketoacyl-[acyl-carrier-protein] synthase II [Nitrospiraceae bacterium]
MRRVVITGIGAVTPLGNDIETTWDNSIKGLSGIGCITKFGPSGLHSKIAGEVKDFSPEKFLPRKDIQRLDPFIHYAVAAATMAAEDAKLVSQESIVMSHEPNHPSPPFAEWGNNTNLLTLNSKLLNSAGVVIGSSRGGISSLSRAMEKHLLNGKPFSAYLMSASTINMASSCISMKFGIKGPALGISTACASGTNAIGEGFRMIRHGEIDVALAGGADAPVCRLAVGGYGASGSLSKRNREPQKASRPFDMDRDGFVIAEGAGVIVLEALEHALKRGARIYAELAGYGVSSDAFHQTRPDSDGEAIAIGKALKDAKVSTEEVDYINAHATSTPSGDIAETGAIKKVFGRKADDIHVSSCKSMLGHMLGAAGAVEAAITAVSIDRGIIIPTINLDNPDPGCDLKHVTSVIRQEINVAVTNSFGFGGVNAVLVLRKFTGQHR